MWNTVIAHPFIVAAVLWIIVICLILFLLWKRGKDPSPELNDPEFDGIAFCARAIKDGLMRRLDMRPRYLSKPHDPRRSELMAAQILADQATVAEDPGRTTHAPAPGERGHREPIRAFRVSVGAYTVVLRREGNVWVEQAGPDGLPTDKRVPEEWSDLVAAMAFEIGKNR